MKEKTVTFFGHRDTPEKMEQILQPALIDLIEKEKATVFYVGNQGSFDVMVCRQLKILSKLYPIKYYVVLAYMPTDEYHSDLPTIFPEGTEAVPRRFAVDFRNKWMLDKADFVVTCVSRCFGGAYRFKRMAEKKELRVIELSDGVAQVGNDPC